MWKRLCLLCLCLAILAGCNDEECAQCPDPVIADPEPTMANLWPHADGTSWVYDLEFNQYTGPPIVDPVPPMPSMQALHAALGVPLDNDLLSEDQGLYRLRFEGNVTTESGVTAQNLVGTLYDEAGLTIAATSGAADGERRLLRLIARVRPDLRSQILGRLGETAEALKTLDEASPPYFLSGYAFAFEDSGYYGYGDLNTDHSWVFLEGDLAVGAQFSMQLIPDIVDDIWLYGQIWAIGDRAIDGVTWPNVLECMYAIDMGVVEFIDESGDIVGEFRQYIYGSTLYAPGFGPIASQERQIFVPDQVLQDPIGGVFEYNCVLAQ
jgi:hypothetical protein